MKANRIKWKESMITSCLAVKSGNSKDLKPKVTPPVKNNDVLAANTNSSFPNIENSMPDYIVENTYVPEDTLYGSEPFVMTEDEVEPAKVDVETDEFEGSQEIPQCLDSEEYFANPVEVELPSQYTVEPAKDSDGLEYNLASVIHAPTEETKHKKKTIPTPPEDCMPAECFWYLRRKAARRYGYF